MKLRQTNCWEESPRKQIKKERAKQLIYELAETNSVVKSEDIVNLAEEKRNFKNEHWKMRKKSWVLKENGLENHGIGNLMKS